MKVLYITASMMCVIGIAAAQGAATDRVRSGTPQKSAALIAPCLLGTERCLEMSTVPVSTCLVTTHTAKAKAGCAVDGMRIIRGFATEK